MLVVKRDNFYWTGLFWSNASNKARLYPTEASANAARLVVGGEVSTCLTNTKLTIKSPASGKREVL